MQRLMLPLGGISEAQYINDISRSWRHASLSPEVLDETLLGQDFSRSDEQHRPLVRVPRWLRDFNNHQPTTNSASLGEREYPIEDLAPIRIKAPFGRLRTSRYSGPIQTPGLQLGESNAPGLPIPYLGS